MRSVRLLAATVLAGAGLVVVGATSQSAHAAGSLNLNVSYSSVMKLETINAGGELPTATARPVKLQYRNKVTDPWLTLKVTASAPNGTFFFSMNTGRTRYFRYYAPAHNGQPSIKGNQRKLTVVTQKVQYFAVTSQCNDGDTTVTMLADFYPGRDGRGVSFDTSDGPKMGYQDKNGVAVVSYLTNDLITNGSATALAYHGAAISPSTLSRSIQNGPCSPN